MTTVTSRRAKPDKKVLATRLALCKELLDIEKKGLVEATRAKVIETELKKIATDANDSFREEIAGLGSVSVAPGHDAENKGDVPQIQTEAWKALKPLEIRRLIKSGLVKIVTQWGQKSYGRVTVKLL